MDITDKPMETIQQWQEWYRAQRKVNILDTSLVSQDSDKKLYVGAESPTSMTKFNFSPSMENNNIYKEKAIEYFSDTICEFIDEMTGPELFDCFKQAVTNYYTNQQKQLDNIKQFHDVVHGRTCQKNCEAK
jgi:transcription elongation factor GreA-like protein